MIPTNIVRLLVNREIREHHAVYCFLTDIMFFHVNRKNGGISVLFHTNIVRFLVNREIREHSVLLPTNIM